MHAPPLLVIVSGPPASGKTTLAKRLAAELRLPLVTKDAIKERLFDTLGRSDREWSKRLGVASSELLLDLVETQLRAGKPLVVESAFWPEFAVPRFREILHPYPANVVEIHCTAPDEVLLERFRTRDRGGVRHPGHVDSREAAFDSFETALSEGTYDALRLSSDVRVLDTTHLHDEGFGRLVAELASRL